jgi:protoporphyrinogen oxidase
MQQHIGIIGGGMMGLAAAHYLSRSGMSVTILEKDGEVGGLSKPEAFQPDLIWDRFYHVILTTDLALLEFISDMGLSLEVDFSETKTGLFAEGRLHSMSSSFDFLRFKPLSLWDKLRLGAGLIYASRIKNSSYLEKTFARTWLIRVFGRRNYERLWAPLLRSKLGEANVKASASFIWACITRLYGARQKGAKKELLGCVKGGYHTILDRTRKELSKRGVGILVHNCAERIEPTSAGTIRVRCTNGETYDFDRVIATVPNPSIVHIWPNAPEAFQAQLKKVNYLSLICAILVLERSLSPYYVTNITDPGFPFTGLIEATHIMPKEILGARGLIYLPRYAPPEDTFHRFSDDEILNQFTGALTRIFPDFFDHGLISSHLYRERYVQPIQETGYISNIPPMRTPLENFYICNNSMILNSTLNNNEVVKLARQVANLVDSEVVGP